eukprot:1448286-Alexandrium_andersonii.AAC.1
MGPLRPPSGTRSRTGPAPLLDVGTGAGSTRPARRPTVAATPKVVGRPMVVAAAPFAPVG